MCVCALARLTVETMAQVAAGVTKEVLKAPPAGARSVSRGDKVTVHCTGHLKATMKKFWR